MTRLEERLNVTNQDLKAIEASAKKILDVNMANDLSLTNTNIFNMVLSDSQFEAYKANEMTKQLCNDLLR